MKNIRGDYFFFGVKPKYQTEPHLILGLMGLLNCASGSNKLFIADTIAKNKDGPSFENCQTFKVLAKVVNHKYELLAEFDGYGTLIQCYRYIVFQYSEYLKAQNDSIFVQQQETVYLDDLF